MSGLISLILGFAALITAFVLEGGKPTALLAPTAALIVFGGTFAAVGVSYSTEELKRIPSLFKKAFSSADDKYEELISFFKDTAVKVRKEGFISLEKDILSNNSLDPFIKTGLQLAIDGVDLNSVRSILEEHSNAKEEYNKKGAAVFDSAGGFAPTMGIIGTVLGLVHVLGNLSDPSSLGPKIAVAFLATLYGISSANIIFLPIGSKLKLLSKKEAKRNEMIIEAILSLQSGNSPNVLEEKLRSFIPDHKNEKGEK